MTSLARDKEQKGDQTNRNERKDGHPLSFDNELLQFATRMLFGWRSSPFPKMVAMIIFYQLQLITSHRLKGRWWST